ncbi:MAG: DoxX family protein [Chlamydiae bacterium]|nr:DoxX family protein [Chlamydiota bacterium]
MSKGSSCCCPMKSWLALLGRVIIGALFLISGLMKIKYWASMVQVVASIELPYPALLLGLGTAIEILGGISIILGYRTRIGALMLIVFLAAATYLFHNFWAVEAVHTDAVREEFVRNIVYLAGLFLLAAFGPGSYSIDAKTCCNSNSCQTK